MRTDSPAADSASALMANKKGGSLSEFTLLKKTERRMKQLRIFFLCLVAATLVTACGGDDKDNSTPVEKITLDKDKLTFVAQWKMRPSHFPEGGFTVVKGDGYTLTQLDLEKITSLEMDVTGSSVTSENCELVLDTAENAIKLRIKATAY